MELHDSSKQQTLVVKVIVLGCLSLERAVSDYDARRRWVLSGGYQLPFGPGKRFGGSTKGWKARLIEGYELFTMAIYQSGPWVTPGMGFQGVRTAHGGSSRPDLAPGVPVRVPGWNTGADPFDFASQPRYYNAAAFSKPADFTLGTAGRNILPTPPLPYQDFAIQKNVSLSERLKLQLRCGLEHAFNNPIWSAPNSSADSSAFGQITAIMGNGGRPALGPVELQVDVVRAASQLTADPRSGVRGEPLWP